MKILKKLIVLSFLLIFSLSFCSSEEETKTKESIFSWDVNHFHFGFGVIGMTGNLLGLIENARLYDAMYNGKEYNNPDYTTEENQAVNNLNKGMQRSLIVANVLGSLEYGIRTRFMYSAFISDLDLIFLPNDGTYNGRFDFEFAPSIGIRLPWFIMPYIMAGPTFTFSYYPDKVEKVEHWKTHAGYGVYENFVFRPGLNTRLGLDLNFRRITIGAFYQYEIKDFAEFTDYYNTIIDSGITPAEAAGRVFGYQSRFGVSIIVNIM